MASQSPFAVSRETTPPSRLSCHLGDKPLASTAPTALPGLGTVFKPASPLDVPRCRKWYSDPVSRETACSLITPMAAGFRVSPRPSTRTTHNNGPWPSPPASGLAPHLAGRNAARMSNCRLCPNCRNSAHPHHDRGPIPPRKKGQRYVWHLWGRQLLIPVDQIGSRFFPRGGDRATPP